MNATPKRRRVVVAAPYPTMPGPEAAATFSMVRAMLKAGDDVIVVSPVPSAAHHHADPIGPRSAYKISSLTVGADLLHVRIDAAAQSVDQESPRLLATRLALHGLVRRAAHAEVRLDRVPSTVGRRWANLVLGSAERVLVSTESERASLVAAGIASGKIAVEPEPEMEGAGTFPAPKPSEVPVPPQPTVADLQELVRRRAAEERATRRRALADNEARASLPLRHLIRLERAPVGSNKPGGAFVKRAVAKAMHWQLDNVIASVNRLHQATIDAVEALEERQSSDDTSR